jgi:hypothetical protein
VRRVDVVGRDVGTEIVGVEVGVDVVGKDFGTEVFGCAVGVDVTGDDLGESIVVVEVGSQWNEGFGGASKGDDFS